MCGQRSSSRRDVHRGRATAPTAPASGRTREQVQAATRAATVTFHEVVLGNGRTSGRKFSSLVAAQHYANGVGGTVKPVD